MKRRIRMALVLTVLCSLVVGNISVMAAESDFVEVPENKVEIIQDSNDSIDLQSEASLTRCTLEIGIADNGISIVFITRATQSVNEIGVKNMVLQEKTWYGWKDIPLSNYCSYSSDMYAGEVTYTGAEAGKTYRVYCTHYIKNGSKEVTLYNETSNLVYN